MILAVFLFSQGIHIWTGGNVDNWLRQMWNGPSKRSASKNRLLLLGKLLWTNTAGMSKHVTKAAGSLRMTKIQFDTICDKQVSLVVETLTGLYTERRQKVGISVSQKIPRKNRLSWQSFIQKPTSNKECCLKPLKQARAVLGHVSLDRWIDKDEVFGLASKACNIIC